jgi:hypothetical protein
VQLVGVRLGERGRAVQTASHLLHICSLAFFVANGGRLIFSVRLALACLIRGGGIYTLNANVSLGSLIVRVECCKRGQDC